MIIATLYYDPDTRDQGILNHSEMIIKFSQAYSEIADILVQAALCAKLYPTDRMRDAISKIYYHIMDFSVRAVKWCHRNAFMRTMSAIVNSYELRFKDIAEKIQSCFSTMREIVSLATGSELRDVHKAVEGQAEKLEAYNITLQAFHVKLDEALRIIYCKSFSRSSV